MSYWKQIKAAVWNSDYTTVVGISDPNSDGVGGLDVYIQDQYSHPVDLLLTRGDGTFTISADTILDSFTFTATGGHSLATGQSVYFEEDSNFTQLQILGVSTNTITVDSPFDHAYTTSGVYKYGISNMSVDASVGQQIFEIGPQAGQDWDIVRVTIAIQDGSSMDSSGFGSIPGGVTNGVVLRQKNGGNINLFNAKTNGDFALRAYDIAYDDRATGSGKFFFRVRRTYGGASKAGVTIRLVGDDSDSFQILLNDDFSGLDSFLIVVQGHVVEG